MEILKASLSYLDPLIQVFGATNTGYTDCNQDGLLYIPCQRLAMVFDGSTSSHNPRGAVDAAQEYITRHMWGVILDGKNYKSLLKDIMVGASAHIAEKVPDSRTTAVITKLGADDKDNIIAYVASVGDSRAYMYDPERGLEQLTHDHDLLWSRRLPVGAKKEMTGRLNRVSTYNELEQLSPEEQYLFERRNWVTQLLGQNGLKYPSGFEYPIKVTDFLEPRIIRRKLVSGSKLILTTDGTGVLTHQEMEYFLSVAKNPAQTLVDRSYARMVKNNPRQAYERHVRAVNDDISVISMGVLAK